MSTYIIGDVQGCRRQLQELTRQLALRPERDRLWLTGDLVNRGPDSLDVLRWAAGRGDALQIVLGNHDLKLLGLSYGIKSAGSNPSLRPVLEAQDRRSLLDWLLSQPLLVRGADNRIMIHAGLKPDWSLDQAEELAAGAARALRERPQEVLEAYFSRSPAMPPDHPAQVLAVFTLTRMVTSGGEPEFSYNGHPAQAPAGLKPWFEAGSWPGARLFFGHWAALGFHRTPQAVCVDSGCVWGGSLTAYCPDDDRVVQVPGYEAAS